MLSIIDTANCWYLIIQILASYKKLIVYTVTIFWSFKLKHQIKRSSILTNPSFPLTKAYLE